MSYPAFAVPQGLYEVSDSQLLPLGFTHSFEHTDGTIIEARYMKFASSAIQGAPVVYQGLTYGAVITAGGVSYSPPLLAGGAATAVTTSNLYAWVIYRGKMTSCSLAAGIATSAAVVGLRASLAGQGYITAVSNSVSQMEIGGVCALFLPAHSSASYPSTSAAAIDWIWR
jgi:hypothetical protein